MRWLLVAGDFTPLGGMDAANHALARYLAPRADVHLVTHRTWPDLDALPTVTVHRVWRPFDTHVLGSVLLAREGRRMWRRLGPNGTCGVVNGGNCALPAANWIHYLHAAYAPAAEGSALRRSKSALTHLRDLAAERRALREARIIICNSRRTRADAIDLVGVDPARAHVVYYGSDPVRFAPVTAAERTGAKQRLGLGCARPIVGFVGALGDRRKAFDTVFDAWTTLSRQPAWDAQLLVVGAGAELPMWQRRAQEAGLGAHIRFAGFRTDVPDILAAVDALVHPARYEAYGLSVHEALCRGVPALVSASAGVAERYPSDLADLLIANPDDVGELTERLKTWRADVERFRSLVVPLSSALRARTWDAMSADMRGLIERAHAA